MIYVLIPTFKEAQKIEDLLKCWNSWDLKEAYTLVIANAHPGDATSRTIEQYSQRLALIEIEAHPTLYWSGTVNCALRYVRQHAQADDSILLMNCDITVEQDILKRFLELKERYPDSFLGALASASGYALSSGVQIYSWMLSLAKHPFKGKPLAEIPKQSPHPVSMLPGRCVFFPVKAINIAGLINEEKLPHYAADYEFTHRCRRHGFPLLVVPEIQIVADTNNTGFKPSSQLSIRERCKRLLHIKSVYHPLYRYRYICLTHPLYARPTAVLIHCLKITWEVICGRSL